MVINHLLNGMILQVVEHFQTSQNRPLVCSFCCGHSGTQPNIPPHLIDHEIYWVCIYICIVYIYVVVKNIYINSNTTPKKRAQGLKDPPCFSCKLHKTKAPRFATFSHHPHSTDGIPAHRLCHHNSSPSLPRDVGWYTWGNCQRPAGPQKSRSESKALENKKMFVRLANRNNVFTRWDVEVYYCWWFRIPNHQLRW